MYIQLNSQIVQKKGRKGGTDEANVEKMLIVDLGKADRGGLCLSHLFHRFEITK